MAEKPQMLVCFIIIILDHLSPFVLFVPKLVFHLPLSQTLIFLKLFILF